MNDNQDNQAYSWTKNHLFQVLTTGKNPILQDNHIIEAFAQIDRNDFVPEQFKDEVYADTHDSIGFDQIIESPILQAQLISALKLKPGMKVLELGTGAGYSLALMSFIIGEQGQIFSLERNQLIIELAKENLAKYSNLKNYEILFKDGSEGLVSRAPFDAIYVSFAFKKIPESLLKQLKIAGKMVIPITDMNIKLITRKNETEFEEKLITVKDIPTVQYGVE